MIALFVAITAVQVVASLVTQMQSIQERTHQKKAQNILACTTPISLVSPLSCQIHFELKHCK